MEKFCEKNGKKSNSGVQNVVHLNEIEISSPRDYILNKKCQRDTRRSI